MSEHTPGPWRAERDTVWTPQGLMFVLPFRQEGPANAEFIVRACNAHDALVAALSAVVRDSTRLEWEKDAPATYEMGESIYQAARAALALVGVQP